MCEKSLVLFRTEGLCSFNTFQFF
uniref:Uncharacterized protein n=1 Tax=Arundo donax TaxID=35708 RepID=A0A0A8Z761_ARUDO